MVLKESYQCLDFAKVNRSIFFQRCFVAVLCFSCICISWLVTFWVQQNMYDEGDDEMKKTIAKAWSDARTGKPAQPPKYGDL
jgi:hypothetical protein